MTDDNSNLVDMDDLDTFSDTFFGKKSEPVATETPEPEVEVEDEDTAETGDDTPATETEKPEDKPRGKKSAQERINEVVAKQREVERERDALARRIAELEAASTPKPEVKQTPEPASNDGAPDPDETGEDGEPKYRLGEFDPQYIRDLTRWTIRTEKEAAEAEQARIAEQQKVEAAQEELTSSWLQKLETVEQELPDLREKIESLTTTFETVEPQYGEFLAATIMSCDHGPEIMYYLSQNIGEAQKIVASGPAAATLALGRLDAKFVKASTGEKRNIKPSAAPEPAPTATRGTGGRFTVNPDTDDLDAFEREFFKKK